MKTILVASDLSVRSDRAVNRAFRLAKSHGSRLVVCNVVDEEYPEDMRAAMLERAHDRLARYCSARPESAEVRPELHVTEGDAMRDIHVLAENENADILVLGLHRARPFFDLFRETTMERLIRASRHPVLLVADAADHDYARILAAVDTSPASTRALRAAVELAPTASLASFYAYHIPFKGLTAVEAQPGTLKPLLDEAERDIDAWFAAERLPKGMARPEVIDGGPNMALARMLDKVGPDLLALGTHARAGAARFILGGFTADLIRDPPCDLLIAP